MDKLLFGISGLPLGNENSKFDYASGIRYVKSIGLDSMELLFVRSVNVTDKNKDAILKSKLENGIYLSAHGSYYINLNSSEPEKQEQSIARILKGAKALGEVQGRSIVFHCGYYKNYSVEDTYQRIMEKLNSMPYFNVDYRLETTGKKNQFGTLIELVSICKEIKTCKLCIDFSHIHARYNGRLKTYEDFADILHYVSEQLGKSALYDMHIHIAGINYNQNGEKNHLPLLESDFNFVECLRALKNYEVKGCVVAEGPLVEKDAILLKKTYENL
ncbi:MAG: TIM barrel protein [Bacillota bacterium]|nr:TIM barrel protein [Bacillota bacterium]